MVCNFVAPILWNSLTLLTVSAAHLLRICLGQQSKTAVTSDLLLLLLMGVLFEWTKRHVVSSRVFALKITPNMVLHFKLKHWDRWGCLVGCFVYFLVNVNHEKKAIRIILTCVIIIVVVAHTKQGLFECRLYE